MNDSDIVRRTDIINRLLDRAKPLHGLIHVDDVIRTINVAPSVNLQEPKTGHWKYAEQLQAEICSCCGCIKGDYFFSDIEVPIKFCPNCGAAMTESEDKE